MYNVDLLLGLFTAVLRQGVRGITPVHQDRTHCCCCRYTHRGKYTDVIIVVAAFILIEVGILTSSLLLPPLYS